MRLYKLSADKSRLADTLAGVGVDMRALRMVDKGLQFNILVKDIKSPAANILKQEAIASGMDAAVKCGVVSCSVEFSDALLLGCRNSFFRLIKRLKNQPFGLEKLSVDIEKMISVNKRNYFFAGERKISLEKPLVMGILNATPDSFSDGGMYFDDVSAERRVDEIISQGADIIDVGGMSSRPGAVNVSSEEEIGRIFHIMRYAVTRDKAVISVDTCNYETASFAAANGALIINDISGLASDDMLNVCADTGVAVCIMHMKGVPDNMQENTEYKDLIGDIKDFFSERIDKALNAGIMEESIILDVGFGFGKSVEQNYLLLRYLEEFTAFGMPILAGVSRKSMIGVATGKEVDERLVGSVTAGAAALLAGADILRVHDVAACLDSVNVINSILKAGKPC